MTRSVIALLLLFAAVILFPPPAISAEPTLDIARVYVLDDSVAVNFIFRNAIESEAIGSVQNGIPVEIVYTLEVWNRRETWFDDAIASARISVRLSFDNWDSTYSITKRVEDVTRTEELRSANIGEIIHKMCVHTAVKTCSYDRIKRGGSYFATVEAEISYLSAEKVREIETWLSGKEEDEVGRGGLLKLVMGMFGSKKKSVSSDSIDFSWASLNR